MKMLNKLRITLIILTLSALLVGLAMPVVASFDSNPSKIWQLADKGRRGDDPWDPGDESEGKLEPESFMASGLFFIKNYIDKPADHLLQLAKRNDDPWDPGDESGRRMEVRHA